MKNIKKGILLFILLAAAGAAQTSSAQTFSGSIANGSVVRGGSAKGTIIMNIPAGLHVNSNRPSSEYAIPTTVQISGVRSSVSAVTYPRGRNRKFQFSDNPINVYEGRAIFGFTVKVPGDYRGNSVRVNATVRYQACTEEVCYPPKTKQITVIAKVR